MGLIHKSDKKQKKKDKHKKSRLDNMDPMVDDNQTMKAPIGKYMDSLSGDRIRYGAKSIVGTRKNQQDAYRVEQAEDGSWTIAIVCDGMGGLEGGEIASNLACDYILEQVRTRINGNYHEYIEWIVNQASQRVLQLKTSDGNSMKAGTTMCLVVVKDGVMNAYSIGDSKIYYYNAASRKMACITNEHNYLFMAYQKRDDAGFVFNNNIRADALTSYLGAPKLLFMDRTRVPKKLENGDRLMICSDGVYKLMSDDEIYRTVSEGLYPQMIADQVISTTESNRVNAQDNTTVVILEK